MKSGISQTYMLLGNGISKAAYLLKCINREITINDQPQAGKYELSL
jgi:hypothetical protein